ncbi:MAG: helix-turn-helix domain-containing protein [Oscillospiraceae bacterium]|jgi:SOS-response transcriptional repressor LexA|nr:helix-turn-helix domain-containing protein [Oscillospiraceae bacterium]
MDYSKVLARLRKENKRTQAEVADYINRYSDKKYSFKMVSHWEKGNSAPPLEQFLLLCELYGVRDIQSTFRGVDTDFRNLSKLNSLGKSRVEEYIALLRGNPLFSETDSEITTVKPRLIRLYDIPVAAGAGVFLDSDSFEEIEADGTVPEDADFAVKVSGDSMTPRFADGQVIFIKEQETLETGEIGIFGLNGDAYVKKLGNGELLSLNARYAPIPIREYDSFHVFGKVVG